MPEVKKSFQNPKDIEVTISEIQDGIYRISGLVDTYGITFNHLTNTVSLQYLWAMNHRRMTLAITAIIATPVGNFSICYPTTGFRFWIYI